MGLGLVVAAILLGGSLGQFFNLPGILIVAGGTFAATSIAFPTDELKLIIPVSRRVFNDQRNEMLGIAQFLVKSMQIQKRDGPVALENLAPEAPTKALGWPPQWVVVNPPPLACIIAETSGRLPTPPQTTNSDSNKRYYSD